MDKVDLNKFIPHRQGAHAFFVSEENNCKHIGNNSSRSSIRQFKFDGEVIPKNAATDRCDYILLNDDHPAAYYIELKGSSIKKAISQVETSRDLCCWALPDYKTYFRIIYHSGSHDIKTSKVIKWQADHKGIAIIKSRQHEDKL